MVLTLLLFEGILDCRRETDVLIVCVRQEKEGKSPVRTLSPSGGVLTAINGVLSRFLLHRFLFSQTGRLGRGPSVFARQPVTYYPRVLSVGL